MIVDIKTTREHLKSLLEREEVTPSLSFSKERKENFKAACELEGIKKFSIVLEDLIGQVNQSFFDSGKKLKIELEGFNDRAVTSIGCESKTWQTFKDGCSKNHLKISDVLESIMGDYIVQVERENGVKIVKGKIKKQ